MFVDGCCDGNNNNNNNIFGSEWIESNKNSNKLFSLFHKLLLL